MSAASTRRFLIDGFPRKLDQAEKFEEDVAEASLVLYFECSEEVMMDRLTRRGETSGRIDDNIDSIRKRFITFRDTSFPVIEGENNEEVDNCQKHTNNSLSPAYQKQGKVRTINAMDSVENVYSATRKEIDALLASA